MGVTLVWFRQDLRLADNPALHGALAEGGAVVPVYIWAPEEEGAWAPGAATRWWLHQSLASLAKALGTRGSRLVLRKGPTAEALCALAKDAGATTVFWNRRYEPAIAARDAKVEAVLRANGLRVASFNSALLFEPWTVKNKTGRPFQVFTPFWRHCLTLPEPPVPLLSPGSVPPPARWPKSEPLASFALEPRIDWAGGMRAAWRPGEAGASANLNRFGREAFARYGEDRNRPDLAGTSRLSPHLHFGEIGPRQIGHGLRSMAQRAGWSEPAWRGSQFLAEVGWREFAHHLLHHFPRTPEEPLRPEFARFPWRSNQDWLEAWRRGRTGYPIVDAGLRELWSTGWMHNRVRMIVASFLVKDLLISWQEGARWFWDTLVDADLANNTLGWQWTAGCGADAAPYFRVFNPVSQGEKFDPKGDYVRRWIPELARVPAEWVHKPWEAPGLFQPTATSDRHPRYPAPIVSHTIAREVALEAFARLRPSST